MPLKNFQTSPCAPPPTPTPTSLAPSAVNAHLKTVAACNSALIFTRSQDGRPHTVTQKRNMRQSMTSRQGLIMGQFRVRLQRTGGNAKLVSSNQGRVSRALFIWGKMYILLYF